MSPWPLNPMGHSSEDIQYRFQWTFPIVFSRHDPKTLYAGGSQLFRTRDEGQSWDIISPPLARNDPKTLGPSGGPITKDQTGVETYGTIFAFDESPITAGLLWVGTDDGYIQLSRDGGKTWTNVTPPTALLPGFARISIVEPGHYSPGTAYVAANRYQMGDMSPYLLKTTDYGKTWKRIDAGITGDGQFTRVIREDPVRRGLLFAGTERGVWISFDDGASWREMQQNLPPVPVHDLEIKDGDLIAATHGRSFYIMDDIAPLRQVTPQVVASPAHLFTPRDAYRVQWGGGFGGGASGTVGANPPGGAVVRYWLKEPKHTVTLEFLDAKGQLIHRFSSALDSAALADSAKTAQEQQAARDSLMAQGLTRDSARKVLAARAAASRGGRRRFGGGNERPANGAGLNQFVWNMRYADAADFRGLIMWAGGTTGPMAPPGTYSVRMLVDGQPVQTRNFKLLVDPRTGATVADVNAQFDMLIRIRDRLSAANNAVRRIRNVRYQLGERGAALHGADSVAFARAASELDRRMTTVEETLYQTRNRSGQDPLNFPIRLNNEIAALAGHVGSSEGAPTAQAKEVYALLDKRLTTQLDSLRRIMDQALPPVNAILERAGQPKIVPGTAELGPDPFTAGDEGDLLELEEATGWE